MADFFTSLMGGLFGQKPEPPKPPVPGAGTELSSPKFNPVAVIETISKYATYLPAPQPVKIAADTALWVYEQVAPKREPSVVSVQIKDPGSSGAKFIEDVKTYVPIRYTGSVSPPPTPGAIHDQVKQVMVGADERIGVIPAPSAVQGGGAAPVLAEATRVATPVATGSPGGKYSAYLKPGRYILSTDTWGLTQAGSFGSAASFKTEKGGDFYDVVGYTSLKLVVHSDGSYQLWSRSSTNKQATMRSGGGPESIKYVDPLDEAGFGVRAPAVATPTTPAAPSPSSVAETIREKMPTADPMVQLRELEQLAQTGAISPRDLAEARQEIESQLITKVENVTVTDGREVIQSAREVIQTRTPGDTLSPILNPNEVINATQALKEKLTPPGPVADLKPVNPGSNPADLDDLLVPTIHGGW